MQEGESVSFKQLLFFMLCLSGIVQCFIQHLDDMKLIKDNACMVEVLKIAADKKRGHIHADDLYVFPIASPLLQFFHKLPYGCLSLADGAEYQLPCIKVNETGDIVVSITTRDHIYAYSSYPAKVDVFSGFGDPMVEHLHMRGGVTRVCSATDDTGISLSFSFIVYASNKSVKPLPNRAHGISTILTLTSDMGILGTWQMAPVFKEIQMTPFFFPGITLLCH